MKKFEFTGEVKTLVDGTEVKRIRALKELTTPFGVVKMGELGGWLEKEANLSHERVCWVGSDALVYDNALVCDNACVCDNARVSGKAIVCGNVLISGNAHVSGAAYVYGVAIVGGEARVGGNAHVYGTARVSGDACVSKGADIEKKTHVLQIGPVGSRNSIVTFYRDMEGKIRVCCGCFSGTLDEFECKVRETHGDNKHSHVYQAATALARLQIEDVSEKDEKK